MNSFFVQSKTYCIKRNNVFCWNKQNSIPQRPPVAAVQSLYHLYQAPKNDHSNKKTLFPHLDNTPSWQLSRKMGVILDRLLHAISACSVFF